MARLSTLIVGVSLTAATLSLSAVANAADAYTVKQGDTLSGIARRVDVPLADLLSANSLTVTSVIHPGQRLTVPDASSSAEPGSTYTVAAGDTLSGIASRHRVSLSSLLSINGLRATSLIMAGMQLKLPAGVTGGTSTAGAVSGSTHTVVAGDTLGGIASRYRVSLQSLLAVNGLRATSLITSGMQLKLPAGATAALPTPTTPAQRVLAYALAQLGKPYVFFTKGPTAFDCSGLSLAAYAQVGIPLVHHAATQAQQGSAVDYWNEAIQAGDLIFLDGDWNGVIDHVGIALNATTWVQASQSRGTVLTGPIPSDSVIIAVRRFLSTE